MRRYEELHYICLFIRYFMDNSYPSALLEDAVQAFAKLPGIGKKTALRLVLHLLRQDSADVEQLGSSLIRLKREIKYCECCHNISDTDRCQICSDPRRDQETLCVVENVKEVMAVEGTRQYNGLYHVLGGLITPMEGIGPSDLEIDSLTERVAGGGIKEVILALAATSEGDATSFYIFRRLSAYPVKISVIARGIAVGDELEYADEVTLGRSILNRTPFNNTK